MPQKARQVGQANDNNKFYVAPTARLDILLDMAKDRGLKDSDVRLAIVLLSYRNNQTGLLCPSQPTLAAELGWSISKVEKSIARLAESGWIKIEHRWYGSGLQQSNQYDFAFEKVGSVVRQEDTPLSERMVQPPEIVRGAPSECKGTSPSDRTDKPDSEIEPSEVEPGNPERFASGTRAASPGGAFGAGRHRHHAGPYKQTKAEADCTFESLKRMPWRKDSDDPQYQPSPEAEDAALIHWHRLLKSGIAASRIERAAERFLGWTPDNQRPCLARFLARYAPDCTEPDTDLYVPDVEQPMARNDNQRPPDRNAVGVDWEDDPPF